METSHPSHSRFGSANPVTSYELFDLCSDSSELRLYLLKSGLLGDFGGICKKCKIGHVDIVRDCGERHVWLCKNRKCRVKISIRTGSFFAKSHLDFSTILRIIHGWIHELPQQYIMMELKIGSPTTVVDWFNFCRDVCCEILMLENKQIGGPGHVVEIDESKFGKRKYNKGRAVDSSWVLGGIDRETKETFFKVIKDRSAEILLPILIENIHPETTVISDCWKSYHNVSQHFKNHKSINHSLHFVDPADKSIHTNTIESQWRVLKRNTLPRNGTTKQLYEGYFATQCVKKKYLSDVPCKFKAFLELIKRVYPLDKLERTPTKRVPERSNQVKRTFTERSL